LIADDGRYAVMNPEEGCLRPIAVRAGKVVDREPASEELLDGVHLSVR
jgi:hypothetical protein